MTSLLLDNIVCEGVIVEQTIAVKGHDGRRLSTPLDHHLSTTGLKSSRFAKWLHLAVCVVIRSLYTYSYYLDLPKHM